MTILPFTRKKESNSTSDNGAKSDSYKKLLDRAVQRNKEFDVSNSVASKSFKKRLEDRLK